MTNSSVPREKIPWFPSINYDLCKSTKDCLGFCPNSVFAWDEGAARIVVINPYNCTVGCDNCVRICQHHAITFPDMEELAAILQRLRSET